MMKREYTRRLRCQRRPFGTRSVKSPACGWTGRSGIESCERWVNSGSRVRAPVAIPFRASWFTRGGSFSWLRARPSSPGPTSLSRPRRRFWPTCCQGRGRGADRLDFAVPVVEAPPLPNSGFLSGGSERPRANPQLPVALSNCALQRTRLRPAAERDNVRQTEQSGWFRSRTRGATKACPSGPESYLAQ